MGDFNLSASSLSIQTKDPWCAVSIYSPIARLIHQQFKTPAALLIKPEGAYIYFPDASVEEVRGILAFIANGLIAEPPVTQGAPSGAILEPPHDTTSVTGQQEHRPEPATNLSTQSEHAPTPQLTQDLELSHGDNKKKNEELMKLSKAINKLGPQKLLHSIGDEPTVFVEKIAPPPRPRQEKRSIHIAGRLHGGSWGRETHPYLELKPANGVVERCRLAGGYADRVLEALFQGLEISIDADEILEGERRVIRTNAKEVFQKLEAQLENRQRGKRSKDHL